MKDPPAPFVFPGECIPCGQGRNRGLPFPDFPRCCADRGGDYSHLGLDIPLWVYIVFQTVFCATAATIVSGSMAERTNFKACCVYSAAISLVVCPICGHWMWGGGWLQRMGFHDFAALQDVE